MHNQLIDNTPFMKILDAAILTVAFVFNAFVLDADYQSLMIAIGGSLSGSIILANFRRNLRVVDQIFNVLCSSIGGLVLGTVLQKYLHIEHQEYRLGLFFACSMLALSILSGLVNIADRNMIAILKGIIQRLLGLQLETEKVKKEVRRNREKIERLEHKEGE